MQLFILTGDFSANVLRAALVRSVHEENAIVDEIQQHFADHKAINCGPHGVERSFFIASLSPEECSGDGHFVTRMTLCETGKQKHSGGDGHPPSIKAKPT